VLQTLRSTPRITAELSTSSPRQAG
jgi:hypothetical protein